MPQALVRFLDDTHILSTSSIRRMAFTGTSRTLPQKTCSPMETAIA